MRKGHSKNKKRSVPLRLGSAGFLDLRDAFDKRRYIDLGDHDPARLRSSLNVNAIAQEVFPHIMTGVRFWPFLLVARDLDKDSRNRSGDSRVLTKLRKIAAAQRQHPGVTSSTRIGPRSIATFRPYQGMFRSICNRKDKRHVLKLARFLFDRRRSYSGDLKFFTKHEKAWKRALWSSLGQPGKEFARFISNPHIQDVGDAIFKIHQKPDRFHAKLIEAATAHALLVCLYGIVDQGEVYSAEKAGEQASLLLKLIRKRPNLPAARYAQWIRLAARSSRPPFAEVTKKARKENKRILSQLRFATFWYLYRRPNPRVLDQR